MDDILFKDKMSIIIKSIEEAGYDPQSQLAGYLQTGENTYITRRNGARDLIVQMDREMVHSYIQNMAWE